MSWYIQWTINRLSSAVLKTNTGVDEDIELNYPHSPPPFYSPPYDLLEQSERFENQISQKGFGRFSNIRVI